MRRGGALSLFVAAALVTAGVAVALPGDLDPTFGTGGLVTTDFAATNDEALAVTAQYGGKVVAAGETNGDFGLVRYLRDGTVDTSFGSGGNVDTPFSGFAQATAVLRLPSNGLLAVGGAGDDFALARYQKDGALDPGFGSGGTVTTSFTGHAFASAVVRQTDNELVAAGTADHEFALARYTKTGSLDPTFGLGGKVVTAFGTFEDEAQALLLQPDGKLVAAGVTFDSTGTTADFALARYNPDGTLDSTFGVGGKVTTDFGGRDRGLAAVLQDDGKIVVAGESDDGHDVALARYNSGGSLDSTFGSGGLVTTDFSPDLARASAVGLDSAGNIVAAGTFFTTPKEFLVLRYTPAGTLDSTFGSGGVAVASFGAGFTEGEALDIQPNGKLLVAGHHGATLQTEDFALARFDG